MALKSRTSCAVSPSACASMLARACKLPWATSRRLCATEFNGVRMRRDSRTATATAIATASAAVAPIHIISTRDGTQVSEMLLGW
ncbi:hypothetical protein NB705_003767 [Xanthomonas sacchari]|nr:hypothetical protein [Xanthomonas sacchari]